MLLSSHANVNATDDHGCIGKLKQKKKTLTNYSFISLGRIPLQWAAYAGHEQNLLSLIYYGSNINHANSLGRTALYVAVYGGI